MRDSLLRGIVQRFVFAFGLVALTWNPSPYNYYRWAAANWETLAPVVLFVGLVLLVGWVVFVRATSRSLGTFGVILSVAIAASILWMVVYYQLIDVNNTSVLGWVVLTLLAAVLTAGISWSHLRRRWAGQADVDDVDEVG